ncbi:peptidoglycan DD-metalloendopeptidase family protein [Microbacterium esteraromaticum]|nr:peptidoglycan DD-metalloendopeptidase family protein [Microbacterium esteraromaticum]
MPFSNPRTYPGHSGVDFPQPRGTAIRASAAGKVLRKPRTDRGGYWTTIQYDNGAVVGYAHQDAPASIAVGARVSEGTVIGKVGSLGQNSTGPHLHMENINNATYAGMMALLDRSRVVGATPTGGSTDMSNWPARALYGEAWVKAAQQKLTAFGLYSGDIDGKDGPASQEATETLQRIGGLKDDGVFGPKTNELADLILAGRNATSRPVRDIQAKVGADPDNIWGGRTSLAAYKWQKANGLTADAIWGPASDAKAFPPAPAPTPTPVPEATPREPVYPDAIRAWNVPLASARTAGVTIDRFIIHHQGSTNDDEAYFKTKNDRGSCPTWQVKKDGTVVEFIPPDMKPSSTGSWNDRSVAVETQNVTGDVSGTDKVAGTDWVISDASHEAIAHLVVWASKHFGFPIDRTHVIGHRETGAATACPGPSMDLDGIVKRAQELAAPDPEPEVPAGSVVIVKAELLELRARVSTAIGDLQAFGQRIDGWLS